MSKKHKIDTKIDPKIDPRVKFDLRVILNLTHVPTPNFTPMSNFTSETTPNLAPAYPTRKADPSIEYLLKYSFRIFAFETQFNTII